jgi:lipopolysaccharide export system permease protein
VLRQFLTPLIYSLAAFSMVFVVADMLQELGEFLEADHITTQEVVRYYASRLTGALSLITPISLLLATLYSLSQMTRHNELTAMRASGISLTTIMRPIIATGILCSIGVFLISEYVTPEANEWAANLKAEVKNPDLKQAEYVDHQLKNGVENREWIMKRFYPDNPTYIRGVDVFERWPNSTKPRIKWHTWKGEYLDGQWWFYSLEVTRYNEDGDPIDKNGKLDINATETLYPGDMERPTAMDMLTVTPEDLLLQLKMKNDKTNLTIRDIRRYLELHKESSSRTKAGYKVELHKRFAYPWLCLIGVLIGIPTGTLSGRQGMLVGIFSAIMGFMGMYPFLALVPIFGMQEVIDPWVSVWCPMFFFISIGFVIALRAK